VSSGLFITLFDKETLNLYLEKGVYGFHQPPIYNLVGSRSRHYHALADYACAREGDHVFFFLKRMIVYGGQIIGSKKTGSFYLNGPYSPIGKIAQSEIYWDESIRAIYQDNEKPGIFKVPNSSSPEKEKCQPYIIRFRDNVGLKGKWILSDQLYFELGEYPYPLPSNSIQGMSFCSLTPGETRIALDLLRKEAIGKFSGKSDEYITFRGEPLLFDPKYGIQDLGKAFSEYQFVNEAHLEFTVLSNPYLLPEKIRPLENDGLCRQIPISPFKPSQMDRADVCYYSEPAIEGGTIPNTIIELKFVRIGKSVIDQVGRYLDWLYKRLGKETASIIRVFVCAPSFTDYTYDSIPKKYSNQIELICLEKKQKYSKFFL
jgi:hypothetical protein